MFDLRRREFITFLGGGGAAVAWPRVARAQQPTMPVVGLLRAGQMDENNLRAFRTGLNELGYEEGRNVAIELHATEQYARLPSLASEFVRRQVAVIYASTCLRPSPPRPQPQQFPSSSQSAATPSRRASLPA